MYENGNNKLKETIYINAQSAKNIETKYGYKGSYIRKSKLCGELLNKETIVVRIITKTRTRSYIVDMKNNRQYVY